MHPIQEALNQTVKQAIICIENSKEADTLPCHMTAFVIARLLANAENEEELFSKITGFISVALVIFSVTPDLLEEVRERVAQVNLVFNTKELPKN
jgi:hypothetical protein